MKLKQGCTRRVLVFREYVIKFPQYRDSRGKLSWMSFVSGLLANMRERGLWRHSYDPRLCPVLLSDPLGFFIVMPRALVLKTIDDFSYNKMQRKGPFWIPCEPKGDSFGFMRGTHRLVVIDYGGD